MTAEEQLFASHRGKRVLLDSNLLLVLLTGAIGVGLFAKFERVSQYTFEDYELLLRILSSFRSLLTTPHILTEVSNLANKLSGADRNHWYSNLAALCASERHENGLLEIWAPAAKLAAMPEFVDFGITDCAVAQIASDGLVITDDHRLSGVLNSRGIAVLNFDDLRAMWRLIQ